MRPYIINILIIAAVFLAILNVHGQNPSVDFKKGELLDQNSLASKDDVADWKMEGPGVTEFKDCGMEMYFPDEKFHHVFWCPINFPGSFVAEWELQNQETDAGLCIISFSAKGNNGEDIFDPSFPKGIVHIPEGKQAVLSSDEWQIFYVSEAVFLAVYSKKELGLMVIVRAPSAKKAMNAFVISNPDKKLYHTQFKHPNGNFIEYDLDSPKDTWAIKSINNKPVNRQFDRWPFFDGNIEVVKNAEGKELLQKY